MSSYIGANVENRISPAFIKEDFVGDGSSANFTLTNEVPGGSSQNVMVVLNNVVQEPDVAYTINDDGSNLPKILAFTGTPASGDTIYVIHRGIGTFMQKPAAGSVSTNELNNTLKIVSGQKIVLNANDKVYAYASAATCDIIAGILQEVS